MRAVLILVVLSLASTAMGRDDDSIAKRLEDLELKVTVLRKRSEEAEAAVLSANRRLEVLESLTVSAKSEGVVLVSGSCVRHPGLYRIEGAGERIANVAQLVFAVAKISRNGSPPALKVVRVIRRDAAGKLSTLEVDLRDLEFQPDRWPGTPVLLPGDSIYVPVIPL